MTLNSSVNGDATNGGFIAFSSGSIYFINCKFDGSFEGNNCHLNGGFVGWNDGQNNVTIDNSLFAPDHISTKFDGCETWIRKYNGVTASVKNSYATREYNDQLSTTLIDGKTFMVLRSSDGWQKFIDAVKNDGSTNAILEARGAKTGLITTRGFRDLLEIGRQKRPDAGIPDRLRRAGLRQAAVSGRGSAGRKIEIDKHRFF